MKTTFKKQNRKMKKVEGFTLIELLIVVAIIGVLSAIGISYFGGYKESSQRSVALQNFKSVVKTLKVEVYNPSQTAINNVYNGNVNIFKSYKNPFADESNADTDKLAVRVITKELDCSKKINRGFVGIQKIGNTTKKILDVSYCEYKPQNTAKYVNFVERVEIE